MATIKLTEKAVARLAAPTASGKQELYWDETQAGFGVLCSGVSDVKTYHCPDPDQRHQTEEARHHRPLRPPQRQRGAGEGQGSLSHDGSW